MKENDENACDGEEIQPREAKTNQDKPRDPSMCRALALRPHCERRQDNFRVTVGDVGMMKAVKTLELTLLQQREVSLLSCP